MNDAASRLPAPDLALGQSASDLVQTGRAELPRYPLSLTAGNRAEIDTGSATIDGSFSIDKLAFTFHVPEVLWGKFRERMRRWGDPHRGGIHYREALEIPDPGGTGEKILIQYAPYLLRSIPFGRVELNPAKMRGWVQILDSEIRPFLRRGWESAHITRIDPAVDYPIALQDHVYFAGNHKGAVYYSGDGIETVYLGSAKSDSRIRIYDKAKELALQGEPVPEHPLTRIEAQRRSPGLSAARLKALPNPFKVLRIARPTPAGLPYKEQLYLKEAEKNGVDSVVKRLGRYEKKRFKENLANMPPLVRHPAEVFEERYPILCGDSLGLFTSEAFTERGVA